MGILSALEFIGKLILGVGFGIVFMIIAGFTSAGLGDSFCTAYHPNGYSLPKRIVIILLMLIFAGLSISSFPYSLSWAGASKGVYWGGTIISVIIFSALNLVACIFMGLTAVEPDPYGDNS
ncbi:hypothetical protein A2V49_00370 [candidate division WWE3 bacterium RBG_19FT_COMBO_34_6]|uniref:Uncharacterized protein n=1 Tax=candidate division WWE3 bacterium RBG_19FT_COMBO_34_6 TaxID=1802612 RepID=A0A1F4UMX3_UNCKA|nr:MAG: hypothetical protein A2V49_00370 [candidate division WWE3 bacterium RBG_19FT_COMBO_34_6]